MFTRTQSETHGHEIRDTNTDSGHTMLSEIMETNYSIVQGIFGRSSYYSKDMKIYKAQWTERAAIKSPILLGLFSRGGSPQQIELHSKCLH